MKKLLLCATILLAGSCFAADSSDGCGVGWKVTQRMSLSATSTRSTTNATLPPTISMTSGLSGCAHHSIVKSERATQYFVEANFENLQLETAQGAGENLATLGELMGCDQDFSVRSQRAPFASSPREILNRGCL